MLSCNNSLPSGRGIVFRASSTSTCIWFVHDSSFNECRPSSFLGKNLLLRKFLDLPPVRLKPDLERVLDHRSKEHPVSIAANYSQAKDVDSLSEAADVTSHVKEGVNDALVLIYTIVESEVSLEVRGRI